MASSSHATINPLTSQITEKLTCANYLLWKTQFVSQVRGANLYGYLDGSTPEPENFLIDKEGKSTDKPNPLHAAWVIQDQQVLAYLLNSVSKEVLTQMVSVETAHSAWTALKNMFSSQSRSRVNNLRIALANAEKGNQSVPVYFARMRLLADELAAAGRPMQDDELISFILAGLDLDYNPLVSALDARPEPITLDGLYSQMANFDQRMELFQGSGGNGGFKSSANAAARGRGYQRGCGASRGRSGDSGTNGQGRGYTNGNSSAPPSYTNNKGGGGDLVRQEDQAAQDQTVVASTTTTARVVRSAASRATSPWSAGTASPRTTFQKRRWAHLQQQAHTG